MAVNLSDSEIQELLQQRKVLPDDWRQRLHLKPKHGHKERELDLVGEAGSRFRLILRESSVNPMAFSVILAYLPSNSNQLLRLRRYNGKAHEHTNTIEGQTFYDFHIHEATERYQALGVREDSYAERTARFASVHDAVKCMCEDCGFVVPPNHQPELFS